MGQHQAMWVGLRINIAKKSKFSRNYASGLKFGTLRRMVDTMVLVKYCTEYCISLRECSAK